jgi:hypothetical protein
LFGEEPGVVDNAGEISDMFPLPMFRVGAVLGRFGLRELEAALSVCCCVDSDSDGIALVLIGEESSSQNVVIDGKTNLQMRDGTLSASGHYGKADGAR